MDQEIINAVLVGQSSWEQVVKSIWPKAELTKAMTISSKESNNQLIWTVDLGEGWGKLPYCCSSPIASRAWTAAYTYLSQKGLL